MKIFISYPKEKETLAKQLYGFLADLGEQPWLDDAHLVGADDWNRELAIAQNEADLIIHLYSKEMSQRKGVVNKELRRSLELADLQPFGANFLAIILTDQVILPIELVKFHYINSADEDYHDQLIKLVDKRRKQLEEPDLIIPAGDVLTNIKKDRYNLIEFSKSTSDYNALGEYIIYKGDDLYWQFINSKTASHVLSIYYDFINEMTLDDIEKADLDIHSLTSEDEVLKSEFQIQTLEYFRLQSLVSLRFFTYYYFNPSAHPNHHITTLNFLGEGLGSPDIKDLLDHNVDNARDILKYCEDDIVGSMSEEDKEGTLFESGDIFLHHEDDEEDVWSLLGQFNFNQHGLLINFSPYDVLPYAFGSTEVLIKWSEVKKYLAVEYKSLPMDCQFS